MSNKTTTAPEYLTIGAHTLPEGSKLGDIVTVQSGTMTYRSVRVGVNQNGKTRLPVTGKIVCIGPAGRGCGFVVATVETALGKASEKYTFERDGQQVYILRPGGLERLCVMDGPGIDRKLRDAWRIITALNDNVRLRSLNAALGALLADVERAELAGKEGA